MKVKPPPKQPVKKGCPMYCPRGTKCKVCGQEHR